MGLQEWEFIDVSLQVSETHLKYDLTIKEFEDEFYLEESDFTVRAQLLEHVIPSYGYRIVEKDKPGALLVDKVKEYGIPPGPIYKELKEGKRFSCQMDKLLMGMIF